MKNFIELRKAEFSELIDKVFLKEVGVEAGDFELKAFYDFTFIREKNTAEFLIKMNAWSNALTYMRNSLLEDISERDNRKKISKLFNEIAIELRDFIDLKILSKAEYISERFNGDTFLRYIFICYSQELFSIENNNSVHWYFSDLLAVINMGHLPCGWDGDFPNGRLYFY